MLVCTSKLWLGCRGIPRSSDSARAGESVKWRRIQLWDHEGMAMKSRLNEDDEWALAAPAEANAHGTHQVAIQSTHVVAERHGHVEAVAASSARVRNRYAEVLERLGR